MPKTRFTPGPWWVFQPEENDPCKGIEAASLSIVGYGDDPDGGPGVKGATQEERDANAYLIASAPELYAALESVEESFQVLLEPHADGRVLLASGSIAHGAVMGAFYGVRESIAAALAKARGEVTQ